MYLWIWQGFAKNKFNILWQLNDFKSFWNNDTSKLDYKDFQPPCNFEFPSMFGSIMVIKTLSGAQLKGMDQKKKQFYVEFYWSSTNTKTMVMYPSPEN